MSKLLDKIGHNEGVSPTLLTVMIPAPILGFFLFVGFVPGLVLMPFYVAYYVALAVARLAGSQSALERWRATQVATQNANVTDISSAKAL